MAASRTKPVAEPRKTYKLRDFTERFQLPRHVKVVGGRDLRMVQRKTGMRRGDYLYLQMLAIDKVSLSYIDYDSVKGKKIIKIPAKSPLKFKILPPLNVSSGSLNQTENGQIYPTVGDLLDVLPTVFQANIGYDDPYLPTIFRKGEVFRLRRRFRNITDGKTFLECEDAAGNVIQLPKSCRGDFTIVEDDKTYTIQEIVTFGTVSRKLKLASDNMKLVAVENESDKNFFDKEEPLYGNVTEADRRLSVQGTDLPLSFQGIITLIKPEMFLVASPRDKLDVRWKVELDLDIEVMASTEIEYDEPVMKEYSARDFVSEFESEFPLTATIVGYNSMPNVFRKYIHTGMDILIHRTETETKLLGSTEGECYCINRKVKGRFRKALIRYNSVLDLVEDNNDLIRVKVLEDIASDVPEFFSLRMGDVLVFKSPVIQKMKIKYGKKTYGECKYVSCHKVLEDGSYQTVKLPDDLDLKLIEMPPQGKEAGFTAEDIFTGRISLPMTVDFLPVEDGCSCIRYDREIQLESLVSDTYILISTLPSRQNRRISGLEAKVDYCLRVPLRHGMRMKLRERLHFPTSYFRLPSEGKWITMETERISTSEYQELLKYSDLAYEEYQPPAGPPPPHCASADCLLDREKEDKKYKILRRKGKSLSLLPQSMRQSKSIDQQTPYRSEGHLSIAGSNLSTENDDVGLYDEDDSIYELYEVPKRNSIFRRLSSKRYKKKSKKSRSSNHTSDVTSS